MSSSAAALKLFDLIQSHRVTAVIYVAAELGIAELLRDGARSLDQLTEATGADRQALGRLLTALSTVGLCSRVDADRYSLTEIGAALDSAAEKSFKAWAIFEGDMLFKSWHGMLETIMTGKTAAHLLGVGNSFDLMARTPSNVGMFNAAMADLTRRDAGCARCLRLRPHRQPDGCRGRLRRTYRGRGQEISAYAGNRFRSAQMRRHRDPSSGTGWRR
jgi:DNA-binding HxlR family transcriptional regulator